MRDGEEKSEKVRGYWLCAGANSSGRGGCWGERGGISGGGVDKLESDGGLKTDKDQTARGGAEGAEAAEDWLHV